MKNKNYLISKKEIKEFKAATGLNLKKERRRIGTSTAIALETIAKSIRNPNKKIRIIDHFPTRQADRHLRSIVYDMVQSLNLTGFEFNLAEITIKFNLYE